MRSINAGGMKALSMDLRERVAKAKGTGSSYAVAERFSVTDSWVRKIWIRARTRGSVAPLPRGGNRARKVDAQGEELVRRWLGEQPDLTIDELRERYLAERQVAVSEPAMRRTVNRMGLSRKKRLSLRRSAKASGS
jgi:transposase